MVENGNLSTVMSAVRRTWLQRIPLGFWREFSAKISQKSSLSNFRLPPHLFPTPTAP